MKKIGFILLLLVFILFVGCSVNNNVDNVISEKENNLSHVNTTVDTKTNNEDPVTRRDAPELATQIITGYDSITINVNFSYDVLECEVEFNNETIELNNLSCKLENLDYNTKYEFVLKYKYFDNVENQTEEVLLSASTLDLDIDFSDVNIEAEFTSAIVNLNIDEKYLKYIDEINVFNSDNEKIDVTMNMNGQVLYIEGLKEETSYILEIVYKSNEKIYFEFETLNQFVETFEYEIITEYYYLNEEDYDDISKRIEIPCIKVLKLKNEETKDLVIPNEVTIDGVTYPITRLGLKFCYNNQYLESVYLSVNLIWLNSNAFTNCTNLKLVKFNEGDITFGLTGLYGIFSNVFRGCSSLEIVDLKYKSLSAVLHIDSTAFYGCVNLKVLRLSSDYNSYIYVHEGAFSTCTSLEEIDSPEIVYSDPTQPFPDQIDPIYNDPNKYY